ncbi:MAG: GNAT family N-acetyltransferase [Gemmatimonadaceae bacterium]
MKSLIPASLRTERLFLRAWSAADAAVLQPVLAANVAHLGPWIPARVSTPLPVPELALRLAGYDADFTGGRAFRYALLTHDATQLLGEVDLFPRAATGRVPLAEADHVELGYWLDAAVTGRGLATEAAHALFAVAETLPGMTHVDIRCDVANGASAAVPKRLGFRLAAVEGELQVWRKELRDARAG